MSWRNNAKRASVSQSYRSSKNFLQLINLLTKRYSRKWEITHWKWTFFVSCQSVTITRSHRENIWAVHLSLPLWDSIWNKVWNLSNSQKNCWFLCMIMCRNLGRSWARFKKYILDMFPSIFYILHCCWSRNSLNCILQIVTYMHIYIYIYHL